MLFAVWFAQQAAWVVPSLLAVVVLLRWPERRYRALRLAVAGGLAVVTGWMLSLPTSVSCQFDDGWPPMCTKTAGAERADEERRLSSAETSGGDGRAVGRLVRRLDRDEAVDGAASSRSSMSTSCRCPRGSRRHAL